MYTKLVHSLLAFLLLIGSTGLVVNKHYCQSELKSTAFFLKARSCHQRSMPAACPKHAEMPDHEGQRESRGCCDDQTEFLKADEDQIVSSFEWDLKKPVPVLISACWPPQMEPNTVDRQTQHYLNYKPPLIVYDLPVRLQTFLC